MRKTENALKTFQKFLVKKNATKAEKLRKYRRVNLTTLTIFFMRSVAIPTVASKAIKKFRKAFS